MNYRHAYHAGNFADVIKHVTLVALLQSLARKETPYCYIDTHAAIGVYDLFSEWAAKNKEHTNGIEKIIQQENPPPLIKDYLDCVHQLNHRLNHKKSASLHYYPGSPMIARHFARPEDRLVVCELQPQEYQTLKNTFSGDKHIAVHHLDGFLGLKAFLPPRERRGLILIDPPYENPNEFTHLAHSLPAALKRFETGVYAIWFPIKEKAQVTRFYRALDQQCHQSMLAIELTIYPDLPNHLNGCGMVVINPPWQFAESMEEILPWIWNALTINHQGHYFAQSLKNALK